MSSYDLENRAFLIFLKKQGNGRSGLDMEQEYREMLDECYETYRICDCSYDPSDILRNVDPVAYRCGFSDYTAEYIEADDMYYDEADVAHAWELYEEHQAEQDARG